MRDPQSEIYIHVVSDTGGSEELGGSLLGLPDTEETDEEVVAEAAVEHLADQEDVGRQSGLQHDGHVGGVEQADGIGAADTTLARRLDRDLDTEALEVDDSAEHDDGRDQVHDVGQILAVEGLLERNRLVGPGEEQVDESNDGTLELGATAGVDGRGRESLPHDRLADVGGDEERDTAAEAVALLEQLVEEDDDEAGDHELDDQENADTGAEVRRLAVETGDDIDDGLAEGQEDGEELLRGLVQLAVRFEVEVDVDEVGAREELENHARGDDGRDTQLHQRSPVTRHHHAQPVERVRRVGGHDAVQRHLAHDQEDEQREARPYQAVVEGDLALGQRDLGHERDEGLDEVEEPYCRPHILALISGAASRRRWARNCGRGCNLRPLMIANYGPKGWKETRRSGEGVVAGEIDDGDGRHGVAVVDTRTPFATCCVSVRSAKPRS